MILLLSLAVLSAISSDSLTSVHVPSESTPFTYLNAQEAK